MRSVTNGLTPAEQAVSDAIVKAWDTFAGMPDVDASDLLDFCHAINATQRILQSRALARLYPRYWR